MNVKSLLKESSIYTISTGLGSVISTVLLFIFAKYLSTSDFGIIATVNSISSVLMIVIMLDLNAAVGVEYFAKRTAEEFSRYLGTSLNIIIGWGLFILVLIAAVPGSFILKVLSFDRWLLVAAWVTAFAGAVIFMQMVIWQMSNKPYAYASVTLMNIILPGAMGLIAVIFFGYGAGGRIWTIALMTGIVALSILPKMWKEHSLRWSIDKEDARNALTYSLPLLPHDLSAWVLSLADRLLLSNMASLATTGLYSVGVALSSITSMIVDGFGRPWVPFVYSKLSEGTAEAKQQIATVGKLFISGVAVICLFVSLFSMELVHLLLPKEYYQSADVIPLISLGFLANGLYRIFVIPMFYVKKTTLIFLTTMIGAASNVLLNILLIPRFAGIGAAWSALISTGIRIGLAWILAQRIIVMPWGVRFFAPVFFCSIIIILFYFLGQLMSIYYRLSLIIVFICTVLSPLSLSGEERILIKSKLSGLLRISP
jgi:O-antigen/teichoic acid export membrane protein